MWLTALGSEKRRKRTASLKIPTVPTIVSLGYINGGGSHSIGNGAPDRIRTCDLWLRRPALYPTELRVPFYYGV